MMGVINFVPSKEISLPSCSRDAYFRQIHVANWRLLGDITDSNMLIIITHNYRTFEVEGLTFDELLDVNYAKGSIERPFRYHSTTTSCVGCHGSGKVDWIEKIMKRNADKPNFPLQYYIRDPKYINLFKGPQFFEGINTIYGSVPHMREGFEACPICKGTGLHYLEDSILYE